MGHCVSLCDKLDQMGLGPDLIFLISVKSGHLKERGLLKKDLCYVFLLLQN